MNIPELNLNQMLYSDIKEIERLSTVSKSFKDAYDNPFLWKSLLERL